MSRRSSRRRSSKTPRIRRRTAPGTAPGTLHVSADSPAPVVHAIKYSASHLVEEPIQDISRLRKLREEGTVVWVDVHGLGNVDVFRQLGEMFDLHPLALEDVVNVHQRAKVEEYGDHLFIVVRMVSQQERLESEQLSIFLGRDYLLTFQERPGDCLEPVRERLRKARGRIRQIGPDYLTYALIDAVVDAYFPIVDEYGERMEQLDEEISTGNAPHLMSVLHGVRGDLMFLRRAIRPLRDALVLLMPDPHSLIGEETQFYLRDCYDHTVQLIDLLDTYRETCSDLRDFYLSSVSNRMNEVMKLLTIIATIFIPLSFITGVYGMNFNTDLPGNMPELNWPFGYVLALLTMLAVAGSLLCYFWRKGWLTDISPPPDRNSPEGPRPD